MVFSTPIFVRDFCLPGVMRHELGGSVGADMLALVSFGCRQRTDRSVGVRREPIQMDPARLDNWLGVS